MVPYHFVFITDMPLTSSGKADRNALLKLDVAAMVRDAEEGVLPSTPDQVYLADLWKQFVEIDEVFIDDNFFDIGGHSILAAKVCAYTLSDRGIDIPLRLFISSTLEQIVEHCFVVKADASSDKSTETVALTVKKRRGWFSRLLNNDQKD
jgi:hypothetical protein